MRGEGGGAKWEAVLWDLTGERRKCNCPRLAAMAAAPNTLTPLAAESSPQEATVFVAPSSSSYTACAAGAGAAAAAAAVAAAVVVAAVIEPASSATSTQASSPAGGCGDGGGGGSGGSTMAAAGRGGSSFKVDTRPCLREGEFPSRGVGAAPGLSLPLFCGLRSEWARFATAPPPTCCGAVKANLAPPRPAVVARRVQDGLKQRGSSLLLPSPEKEGGSQEKESQVFSRQEFDGGKKKPKSNFSPS